MTVRLSPPPYPQSASARLPGSIAHSGFVWRYYRSSDNGPEFSGRALDRLTLYHALEERVRARIVLGVGIEYDEARGTARHPTA